MFAADQLDCNRCCDIRDVNMNVCIILGSENTSRFFHSCCPDCMWVNFRNESQGESFLWSSNNHHYEQFNCVNSSNNNSVVQQVLVIPKSTYVIIIAERISVRQILVFY